MKVLVAGGAGYVGCMLVRELLSRGHAVTVFDRMFFGDAGVPDMDGEVELVNEDIRQISASQLEGVDAVINLAGISSDPVAQFKPQLTYEMNVTGAVHLAHVCKESGVRRYLYASSCAVYDSDVVDNASDVLLDESSPVHPTSPYAMSKLEAERQLLALADREFCPVFLRKGTVYGYSPRMRYDLVINTLLKDALSRGRMVLQAGGETWRPLVEVRDAARAYVECLEADEHVVAGEAFNVVFGNFRVSEMALRIRETLRAMGIITDIQAEYSQQRVRSYRVSGTKLEKILRFTPSVGIQQSVEAAVTEIRRKEIAEFEDPKNYNIRWFQCLEEKQRLAGLDDSVFC